MTEKNEPSTLFDFDRIASGYDKWYETAEGRLFDMLEKRALRSLIGEVDTGENLLEVGAGTGWWSHFFSELGYRVTGVDFSPKMVEIANSKTIPNARFEKADANKLTFPDHHFSASAAITTIEFTPEPKTVIREMVRCTKSGGKLFLGVLNGDAPLNKQRKKQAEGPFKYAHFFTAEEIYALLAPYGKPAINPCAFPLSLKLPLSIAGMADDFQTFLKRTSGALIVAGLEL